MNEIRLALNEMRTALANDLIRNIEMKRNRLNALDPNAFAKGIAEKIAYEQLNVDRILEGMEESLRHRITSLNERVRHLRSLISAADPKAILARGYSVVTDESGNIISSADDLSVGQSVTIETGRGSADARITKVEQGGCTHD